MISTERFAEINNQIVDRHGMFYWQVDRPIEMSEFAEIFMQRHDKVDDATIMQTVDAALTDIKEYAGTKATAISDSDGYKQGSVNINRLVRLNDGRELVLRMHPAGLRNGYFDVEAAAMDAARQYVPTPECVAVQHGNFDIMLMSKMPGRNMKEFPPQTKDEEMELVRDMGRSMARIHQVQVEGFGFFDNEYAKQTGKLRGIHNSFRDHVLAALAPNLAVITDAGYITPQQATKITELLSTSALTNCDSPRLLHNDIADWNVLADNGKMTAILDWDECFAGDPVADIACWSLFFPTERLKPFLEGYQEISSVIDNDFDAKLHLYRLRYIASKMSLRHRKLGIQKDSIMAGVIAAGLQALKEESAYFDL